MLIQINQLMAVRPLYNLGRYMTWLRTGVARPEKPSMYYKETVQQMYRLGIGSLGIVIIISIFIGAVTSIQLSYQFGDTFIPKYYVGYAVRDMVIIELAPTITSLILAGKMGSNMATELGVMRQKEQIDAMDIMGLNTASYLVWPKLFAAVVMIPLLIFMGAQLSIFAGYIATVPTGYFTSAEFIKGITSFYDPYTVFIMFVKSFVFAFILSSISCYQGYHVTGGSVELGRASTRAVVYSDILILVADYIIALVMTG